MTETTFDITLLRNGDENEWERLVQATSPRIYTFFRSVVAVSESVARELVNETYEKAFAGISKFRAEAKIETWLSAIASNMAKDFLRRRSREDLHVDFDDTEGENLYCEQKEIDDETEKIAHLLEKLPENYRKVLFLYYMNEHKYEQIAETLGIPLGSVKTLLFRGKKALRELYIKTYGEYGD